MTFLDSDITILDILRKRGGMTVSELSECLGVTGTAVRQRLNRLLEEDDIHRECMETLRGRPRHCYTLTTKGRRRSGENFADLAIALWQEIRAIDDAEMKRGVLQRVSGRMAQLYAGKIEGKSVVERMNSLAILFSERRLPVEINTAGEVSQIRVEACPYPELAEQDRSVCSLERLLFSEMIGETLRLTDCRLDGDCSCTFQVNKTAIEIAPVE
ncbi:MAG: winged helix-turn-helix transcriptional regulator [Planctomycetaceae bacterium]|nr:winged helix-turn-helix transcriptional regulator [Planctomycetaceae bacterium]MBT6846653.1 winged helix-turn-helix transcriptional regulator [Planctomycetaceae bacterium]